MPNEDLSKRIGELETKIDAIYQSVEKTRKYFLTTLIVSAALVVLPFIGLIFAVPSFMSTYSEIGALEADGW